MNELVRRIPAFRQLAGKTQVLVAPDDGRLRSRLTHTLEVSAIATRIARALGADADLVQSIALLHDIGHPPFGHAGERALAHTAPGGFHHAAHGARLLTVLSPADVDVPEEVVDGVLRHSKGRSGAAFARGGGVEAAIVRAADLYAYAYHDIEDGILAGLLAFVDLPFEARSVLGETPDAIRETLIVETIAASSHDAVQLPPRTEDALASLRAYLYRNVYEAEPLLSQSARAAKTIERLFAAYDADEEAFLAAARRGVSAAPSREARAVDCIASLTDREALALEKTMLLGKAA